MRVALYDPGASQAGTEMPVRLDPHLRCEDRRSQRRSFHDVGSMTGLPEGAMSVAAIRLTDVSEYLDRVRHSALMLAARITLPHFSVSSAMNLPKSPGERAIAMLPKSAKRALILGSARPAL